VTRRALLVEGRWEQGEAVAEVRAPWDGRTVAEVAQASADQVERALAFAEAGRRDVGERPTYRRREVLFRMVAGLKERAAELTSAIVHEAGKPRQAAQAEVARAVETFTLAASELPYFGGRTLPADLSAASAGYECETRRFPAGVVVGIVPFNFPLNLGAHKVAPALAVGAPIIVKPPPQAPSALLLLAQIALDAGAPAAALQVLPCDNARAEALACDRRARVLSFTGGAKVGWHLKARAPGKVVLELGGNAAVIVCADANLEVAAERCALGGFNYAGQVCIKVQRIFVERSVHDAFLARLGERAAALPLGDPDSPQTVVGPVIDDGAALRIRGWVDEAVAAGAVRALGGPGEGRLLPPTVLTSVPREAKVVQQEVFGPVLVVEPFDTFDEALAKVNDSAFGLQAGVFTRDLGRVRQAFHRLEVGGVVVNDYPTFRSDNHPYGGVKGSGLGREGVRYAMEDFTEERVLVTRVV
jgi:acyl-CoA reductase-like NAD-dependent aldehyde dehydrogenase